MKAENLKQWYVLSARDGINDLEEQFERLSRARIRRGNTPVEYFMPTCVEMSTLFGTARMRRRKLLGNYIFVRDTYKNILEAKQVVESMWLLPHPDRKDGEHEFMTISDHEMDLFKAVARAYANELPCYPIGMVDLEEGDKVEIIGGDFDGMRGTLQCSQGRNGGKVLMAIGNLFVIATPDIKPQYIRILEFGKGNRHPYRQFEAHLPRAIQALRHKYLNNTGGLTTEDLAAMSVFKGRYEALRPATINLASQHATLMLMSCAALEDHENTRQWLNYCRELLLKVKSETQRAWQLAFMFAATGEARLRQDALSIVSTWDIAPNDHKRAMVATALNTFTPLFP
ncbi:MAG: hypothetical protein J5503_02130 [Muribaculaceae bacterium]|nr:hypothetical protein [Muribaculaceae bacterium]